MLNITKEAINNIRISGFRPQIVGAIHKDGKILMCYKDKYKLWMFPQGGIDNNETLEIAFWRELTEELGSEFVENCKREKLPILENKAEFPKNKHGSRELVTDSGDQILMKGKYYFVIAVESTLQEIDAKQTEFDKCEWFDYEDAKNIANNIYQPSKKRITREIIEKMHELGLVI